MVLFCKRRAIVVLFILINNFIVNFAQNQTHIPKISTKVLTNFLKVPWVNLNSSWRDAVSSSCRDDIMTFYQSAEAGEMWALEMLDASSKVPSGILIGNIRDLGMYDECLKVKGHNNPANIQGQHCMVSMAMPTKFFGDIAEILYVQKLSIYNPNPGVNLSLTTAVCLPSSCSELDINGLVTASIASSPEFHAFEVGVAKVKCSNSRATELTLGSMAVFSFFAVIAFLLLSCTICEFILKARSSQGSMALKTATQFSLYSNVLRLSSTKSKSNTMPALNGIRFLSACFVVLGHRAVNVYIEVAVNTSDALEMRETVLHSFLLTVLFIVDTFFLLSGFLVTLSFLQMFRSGKKINIFAIYFHRYLRLTPCIAILLLFTIFVIPYLGSGPNWDSIYDVTVKYCQTTWWTNLLHVQNLVNVDEMCLTHTWYVATEMQLFWLSPIILYPLYYRPKLGLFMLSLLSIAAFSVPGIQLAINKSVFFWDPNRTAGRMFSEFQRSYPMTYNRVLPYLLGIFLGYDVFYNKRQISKFQAVSNWILAGLSIIFCIWTARCIQPNGIVYDVIWEVISVSVARLAWSFAMAWTVYACTQGHGGPITKLLSLPIFLPLARLSYSIYLVHFILQITITATERTAEYKSPFKVFYIFWGDLALSIIFASVLYLFIESPICTLEKILRSGRPSATATHGLNAKQTALPAAVKKYLERTDEGKTNSDFIIETITLKLDFWQAVSAELNRLNKEPLKTPIEWSKILQDWRSELSNLDHMLKTRSTGIQNEELRSQAIVTALEKDLMAFLATLNCTLIHNTNYTESAIMKSKSQSEPYNRQHGDSVRLSISGSNIIGNAET